MLLVTCDQAFIIPLPATTKTKRSPIAGYVIHKTKTYLGLYHGGSLSSKLLDSLEDIHHTLTLQSLYQNTEGAEHSSSTNPSTGKGKRRRRNNIRVRKQRPTSSHVSALHDYCPLQPVRLISIRRSNSGFAGCSSGGI